MKNKRENKKKKKFHVVSEHPYTDFCLTYVEFCGCHREYTTFVTLLNKNNSLSQLKIVSKIKHRTLSGIKTLYLNNLNYDLKDEYSFVIQQRFKSIVKKMQKENLRIKYKKTFNASEIENILGYNTEFELLANYCIMYVDEDRLHLMEPIICMDND